MYNIEIYSDSSGIANLFNSYFTNIGHSLSDTLETNSFDPIQYVPYITETISLNSVSSSECSKILSSLKNTAQNSKEMSFRMLIDYRDYFAQIVSKIMILSFIYV